MSQRVKKSLSITAFIIGIFLVSAIIFMFVLPSTADEAGVTYELIGDGTIKTGIYYHNGDKESFYYEVFDDQTIQLGGIEPVEYVIMTNFNGEPPPVDSEEPEYQRQWDFIYRFAEFQSERNTYVAVVMNFPGQDSSFKLLRNFKSLEEYFSDDESGVVHYYEYIDEKTISHGDYVFMLAE
ncbi:MAG: hypothetical protein FWG70_05220 [Oscillospiraceae bacterium]|nr:hypothetical protein [Oscillospiraceae bacterium]